MSSKCQGELVQVLPHSTVVDVNDLKKYKLAEGLAFLYLVLYLVVLLSFLVVGTLERAEEGVSLSQQSRQGVCYLQASSYRCHRHLFG